MWGSAMCRNGSCMKVHARRRTQSRIFSSHQNSPTAMVRIVSQRNAARNGAASHAAYAVALRLLIRCTAGLFFPCARILCSVASVASSGGPEPSDGEISETTENGMEVLGVSGAELISFCLSSITLPSFYFCQLVEVKSGETYNGHLENCDSWMNINLKDVICTSRVSDGTAKKWTKACGSCILKSNLLCFSPPCRTELVSGSFVSATFVATPSSTCVSLMRCWSR
jgi:small nuclear ribonucleoprotein (snRNP)-like protein